MWLQLLLFPVEMFHVSSYLSAEDLQADCQSATDKVFRYQKILQGTSFHILATAVGKSPSVLGTIDAGKAEKAAKLSGAAWPNENPTVLHLYSLVLFSNIFNTYIVRYDNSMYKESV